MADRWELGSEFHWEERYTRSSPDQNENFTGVFYATARVALRELASHLGDQRRRLHLPAYFCPEVTASLAQYFEICWYRDYPTADSPDFDSLHATPGDLVLAVNYFGVRSDNCWSSWIVSNPDVLVIDDFSHDPNPHRMSESPAHYVVASLRKTLPLPDGAVLLSPKELSLPVPPEPSSTAIKLDAMVLKSLYLRGSPIDKSSFRQLQVEGEAQLSSGAAKGPAKFTMDALNALDLEGLRSRRKSNVEQVLQEISYNTSRIYFRPLFEEWPHSATPFNAILQCSSQEARDRLRQHLIGSRVYPAVHWAQTGPFAPKDAVATKLSEELITLPCDFRYGPEDMHRLLGILSTFQV